MINPLCYGIIVYFMIGFNLSAVGAVYYCVTAIVLATVATSVGEQDFERKELSGYMGSMICGTIPMVTSILPLCIIPLGSVSGILIAVPSIPVFFRWLRYISWYYYSYETLSTLMWNDVGSIPGILCLGKERSSKVARK